MVKYTLLRNNDKTITQISELDRKMLRLLKNLYKENGHFYKYKSQMLSLQGLFETLGDEEEQEEEEQEEEGRKKRTRRGRTRRRTRRGRTRRRGRRRKGC